MSELNKTTVDQSDEQREARRKSDAATLNENALRALPGEFPGITFPESLTERNVWRATQRSRGYIGGLPHLGTLTILATNGIVAWYARRDIATATYVEVLRPFLGHVTHFTGEVAPLFSAGKITAAKVAGSPSPRMTRSTSRAAILACL